MIPAACVQASTSPQIKSGTLSEDYGYQWWVDAEGYYIAVGFAGQFIFVVPEKNLVVVFTSGGDFPIPEMLLNNYIIPAAKSKEPLPPNPEGIARLDTSILLSAEQPVPIPAAPLPDTADRITGQTYVFDPNNLDYKQFSLTFTETEALYTLAYRDKHIEVSVGMDGVYRLTDSAGYTRAYRGYWVNDSTFKLDYQLVGYSEKGSYELTFFEDRVTVRYIEDSTGTMETFTGQLQE